MPTRNELSALFQRIYESNFLAACWRTTEKCGKPRVVPLLWRNVTAEQYQKMAAVLPKAREWTNYDQIEQLLDVIDVPVFSRKGNLPRLILTGLVDRAESDTNRLDAPMQRLPRGQ